MGKNKIVLGLVAGLALFTAAWFAYGQDALRIHEAKALIAAELNSTGVVEFQDLRVAGTLGNVVCGEVKAPGADAYRPFWVVGDAAMIHPGTEAGALPVANWLTFSDSCN